MEKIEHLRELLLSYGRVGIAFSGGVDSSFLLKSSLDLLGAGNVCILHAHSCLQCPEEQVMASSWLSRHGYSTDIEMLSISLDPLTWKEFVRNPKERCYLCKRRMYSFFLEQLELRNFQYLLDGTNIDDLKTGRPGLRAIHELDVQTPLVEAGLGKDEIRKLSKAVNLDTFDLPSSSCLATRIPHELTITSERLDCISRWERKLASFGFAGCRVKISPESEKILYLQVLQVDMDRFATSGIRHAVFRYFMNLGIERVFLDLEGR